MLVVLAVLGILGLILIIWTFVDEKPDDVDEKPDAVDKKVDAVKTQIALLGRFLGGAILLVALSLWLSQCELRPTVAPADQIGYVGQPLPDPVAVQVQTNSGSVEGTTVVFAPTSGDGTATPDAVVTDSAGRAQTIWTLGSQSGQQTLVARVLGGGSISITATAQPAPTENTPDSADVTR